MLTPRRDLIQPSRSVSNTPFAFRRADSDPVKQLALSFNGAVTTPTKQAAIPEAATEDEKVSSLEMTSRVAGLERTTRVNSDDGEMVSDLYITPKKVIEAEELNIEGALTDELKILQDRNRHLHQQVEVLCMHNVAYSYSTQLIP